MVGTARRMQEKKITDTERYRAAYDRTMTNEGFVEVLYEATADVDKVKARIELATQAFSDV
jgi:hypothetical protein